MHLPDPASRRPIHTRQTVFDGFLRDDGLWDIEARLSDTKAYAFESSGRGTVAPGTPIHGMAVRLTINAQMAIVAVATNMAHTPYPECGQAAPPLQGLVGLTLGRGWRRAIDQVLGGTQGCTHLRELLFNMATAAYQTVWPWVEHQRRAESLRTGQPPAPRSEPPPHLGTCMTWAFDSPVTQRVEPLFYRPATPPVSD